MYHLSNGKFYFANTSGVSVTMNVRLRASVVIEVTKV